MEKLGLSVFERGDGDSILIRLYEWAHEKFPKYADCRPIYVEQSIRHAGFEIEYKEKLKLVGLRGEIVIGVKTVKC